MCKEMMKTRMRSRIELRNRILPLAMVLFLSVSGAQAENILFISAGVPDAKDQPMIDYLESRGHVVTLLDDDDVADQGEALALANDAIIASETSSSSKVANLRKDVEVPLVCLEYYAWDDFGMVAGGIENAPPTSNFLTIVSPHHYLAAGLSGSVQVFDDYSDCAISPATVGSEATVIARADGIGDVIFVYEKGSTLADGSVAAEIRLGFGFGLNSYDNWTENTFKLLEAVVNQALGQIGVTTNPTPSDTQTDVFREVVLSWSPSAEGIQTYNLYLGTDFKDVNSATVGSPLLVAAGLGLDANSYDVGRLEFGLTYYWRVDGVGAEDPKGSLWAFTVEPYARPIDTRDISATASSQFADQAPEKTIDRSGLDVNDLDLHLNVTADMWLSNESEPGEVWIQYEFSKPYKLHQMRVWNYNGSGLNRMTGCKEVVIQYSLDGVNWTSMDGPSVFAQGPGTSGYAANTTIDFNGVTVRYVHMAPQSNWSGGFLNLYGLSEVEFLHVPLSARKPNPQSGATDVALDAVLSWRAGRQASEHRVYFGTDESAVAAGTAPVVTVDQAAYSPSSLELGVPYYWRVDEVNDAEMETTWEGPVWNFTATRYVLIDGFEAYDDEEGQGTRIYETWLDGYGIAENGSQVGHSLSPFAEQTQVHGGRQSMPLYYDNTSSDYSVADFAYPEDLTENGATNLLLYFRGDEGNDANEPLWVQLTDQSNASGKVVYGSAPDEDILNIAGAVWIAWSIPLDGFNVDVTQVKTLSIGMGETDGLPSGRSGLIYIDDVQRGKP